MSGLFPAFGSTDFEAEEERARTGPYKPSTADRIFTLRITAVGPETATPNIRIRLARAGVLMSLGHEGDWEIVRLRSAWITQADFENWSDQNGVAIDIIAKATCSGAEYAATLDWEEIDTGVPGVMSISTGSGSHPHIRWSAEVGRDEPGFTMPISRRQPWPEKDVERLVWRWMFRNHDDLLRYWWFGESWNAEEQLDFVIDLRPIITTCTFCGQQQAVLQIGQHVAWCKDCKPRPRASGEPYECPFDRHEREQAALRGEDPKQGS